MNSRINFQTLLESLCPNVYFQAPSNTAMKYPAIIYSRKKLKNLKANDGNYVSTFAYDVTIVDRNPDSHLIKKLSDLKYSTFDRQYVSDGLTHITFVIYY